MNRGAAPLVEPSSPRRRSSHRLGPYRRKRDVSRTAEPRGGTAPKHETHRFVIQKHEARRLHFDLRLEWGGVFKSWAVTKRPSLNPSDKRLAVEVEDHPLDYGDLEGTIPKGQYGSGTLQVWDRGAWMPADDMDPADGVPFTAVIAAALEVRDRLETLGLSAFCKTSGSKGLHVVSSLRVGGAAVDWPLAKEIAHLICSQMAHDSSDRYVATPSKQRRDGKSFLDYLRNDRTATVVALLSPRARAGASVSMPIDWSAVVRGLEPRVYTLLSAPERLRETQPWNSYAAAARPLRPAARRLS